jgi:hypothetical protein
VPSFFPLAVAIPRAANKPAFPVFRFASAFGVSVSRSGFRVAIEAALVRAAAKEDRQ